ncbi:MAG: NTP transferase domain-containing protein [bacterium]|nr:NTP transferase domain-containing protein [bacterium]
MITGVIQARLGSRRLPGKMLMRLKGISLIEWVVRRLKRSSRLDEIIAAIPSGEIDDPLECALGAMSVEVFRGSENDVLGRFCQAARRSNPQHVVRVCADNPLVSWEAIDLLIERHLGAGVDYSYNHVPRRNLWPDGLGAEIASMETLDRIDRDAVEPDHREHLFNYLWAHPDRFLIQTFDPPVENWRRPEIKLDVDAAEDLEYLERFNFSIEMTVDEILNEMRKNS